MLADWRATDIATLCDHGCMSVQTGPFGSQLHAHDYTPVGVPVVPTEAIGKRVIDTSTLPRVAPETAERLGRHKLRTGDILFARRGVQATGLSALVKVEHENWLCGTGAIRLRIHSAGIDPQFLSFLLSSASSIAWFKTHAVGAVMPNLNEGVIRDFPLLLPPPIEQRAIAHILSTLDDKIELNRHMNETLEAIARTLFQSWFVDFDPVRAKAEGRQPVGMDADTAALFPDRLVDSDAGRVPQGWLVSSLPEVVEINPPRALRAGNLTSYLEMSNLPTASARALGWEVRPFGSGMRFMNGDVLLARITPCLENGKTAYVDFLDEREIGWGSTEFIVLRSKPPLPPEYAYFLARSQQFRAHAIQNMTGTSGRQRVPADCFNSYTLATPPAAIAQGFGEVAGTAMLTMRRHDEQSSTLAAIRDTLLPKLLSGQIRVKEAERAMEVLA